MHVGNQMVSGTTLQRNMVATRTVIVEVKYINSKNVVIHSENWKVEIPLDITYGGRTGFKMLRGSALRTVQRILLL